MCFFSGMLGMQTTYDLPERCLRRLWLQPNKRRNFRQAADIIKFRRDLSENVEHALWTASFPGGHDQRNFTVQFDGFVTGN